MDIDSLKKEFGDYWMIPAFLLSEHEYHHKYFGLTSAIQRIGVLTYFINQAIFEPDIRVINRQSKEDLVKEWSLMEKSMDMAFTDTKDMMEAVSAFIFDGAIKEMEPTDKNYNRARHTLKDYLAKKYGDHDFAEDYVTEYFEDVRLYSESIRNNILTKSHEVTKIYQDLVWIMEQTGSRKIPLHISFFMLCMPSDDRYETFFTDDASSRRFRKLMEGFREYNRSHPLQSADLMRRIHLLLSDSATEQQKLGWVDLAKFIESIGLKIRAPNMKDYEELNEKTHPTQKIFYNPYPYFRKQDISIFEGILSYENSLRDVSDETDLLARSSLALTYKLDGDIYVKFNERVPEDLRRFWATNWIRTMTKNAVWDKNKNPDLIHKIRYNGSNGSSLAIKSLVQLSDVTPEVFLY